MDDRLRSIAFKMASEKREIKNPTDLPKRRSWAILIEDQITPYTGYEHEPGGIAPPMNYIRTFIYLDQSEWEKDITKLVTAGAEKWRACTLEPATVDISVKVSIK